MSIKLLYNLYVYIGYCPLPLTVTTRSIIFVIGDSYKPSFATVTGRGHHPMYIYIYICILLKEKTPKLIRLAETNTSILLMGPSKTCWIRGCNNPHCKTSKPPKKNPSKHFPPKKLTKKKSPKSPPLRQSGNAASPVCTEAAWRK